MMEIKAKSKFDYKTIRAFVRSSMFRKKDPVKKLVFYCLWFVILAAVVSLEIYLLGPSPVMIILLILCIVMLLLEMYMFFVVPRIRYNALAQMKGCVNEYVFRDEYILATTKDKGFSGESRIDYKFLSKTIETGKYLYIFQNKTQAMIVEKATVTGGTSVELREKLRSYLGGRYEIYKY